MYRCKNCGGKVTVTANLDLEDLLLTNFEIDKQGKPIVQENTVLVLENVEVGTQQINNIYPFDYICENHCQDMVTFKDLLTYAEWVDE